MRADAGRRRLSATRWRRRCMRREQAALAAMPETLASLSRDTLPPCRTNSGRAGCAARLGWRKTPDRGWRAHAAASRAGRAQPGRAGGRHRAADGHGLVMLMGRGWQNHAGRPPWRPSWPGTACRCSISPRGPRRPSATPGRQPAGLTVSRIDPSPKPPAIRQHVLDKGGAGLNADARALLKKTCARPARRNRRVSGFLSHHPRGRAASLW